MLKLIKKYQKWGLAFFGVLLMLTFLGNRGGGGEQDAADHVIGYLDGRSVSNANITDAASELKWIDRFVVIPDPADPSRGRSILAVLLGPKTASDMLDNPQLYFLAREEARQSGVPINIAEVDQIMSNYYRGPAKGTDQYDATRAALSDLLMVCERYQKLANDLKISQPALDHLLEEHAETVGINFVQLQAGDYASRVPPPTTQQVQEQFDKFANTLPGNPEPGVDPFGFGYKLPVRARVQSLRIEPKSIVDAVIAAGPDGIDRPAGWSLDKWWDLAGMKYYLSHQDDYRESPAPDTKSPPTGVLPVQAYAKVRDQILSQIRQPSIDKLTDDLKTYLTASMTNGWQTYQQYATATPRPSTEPVTSLGATYASFSFIQSVANQTISKFNVVVLAHEDPLPEPVPPGTSEAATFIGTQATEYLKNPNPKSPTAIAKLMHPSQAIQPDSTDAVIMLRVSAVLPSAPPSHMDGIRATVESDVRLAASYALARKNADDLLAAANKGQLERAATAMGDKVISTNPLIPLSMTTPEDAKVRPTDVIVPPLNRFAGEFVLNTFGLLGDYNPKSNPHPAKLVELQADHRLFVVQLKDVYADWSSEDYFGTVVKARRQLVGQLLPNLAMKWFDYDEVVRRTGFKPEKT